MKRAAVIFCILFALTLAVPAITNAIVQSQQQKQTAQSELVTIFDENS